jgi:hypothetical protein
MATENSNYPATLEIDYVEQHDQVTSFFRLIWAIPAIVILSLLTGGGSGYVQAAGRSAAAHGGGIVGGLAAATALMILFQQKYPRWWFNFALELNRLSVRVGAYLFLLTDTYPSTTDEQAVHLNVTYPNVKKDLNNWLPLVKWLLAIPHYIVLFFLFVAAFLVTIYVWFAILFTGRYPRNLFDFVVGTGRWALRVNAYALLLTTDQYPPFSLK